jgi:hypothetical protein
MRDDGIHRALRDDPGVQPSPDFAARVMGAIRQEVDRQEALRFPWWLALGGVTAVIALVVAVWWVSPPEALADANRWLRNDDIARIGPWLTLALVSTFLPVWWTYRRTTRP